MGLDAQRYTRFEAYRASERGDESSLGMLSFVLF